MQGTIQRLIRGKGFGFIVTEGQKYFFHHSEVLDMKFKRLSAGDVVEFQPKDEEEGNNPRATDIVLVEKKQKLPRRPKAPGRPDEPASRRATPAESGDEDAPLPEAAVTVVALEGGSAGEQPAPDPDEAPPDDDEDDDEFISGL